MNFINSFLSIKTIRSEAMAIGLIVCFFTANAQIRLPEKEDTTVFELKEIVITNQKNGAIAIRGNSDLKFNLLTLRNLTQIWGQPDVTNILKTFSGINTAGDYGAGLMIDGGEGSHVLYRLDKVPVFFPYRFGGVFSTFNTSHFGNAEFKRNILSPNIDGRLGSVLDFEPSLQIPSKIRGEVSVGLITSSFTTRIPLKDKFGITASARISYFDLILGRLIKTHSSNIKYYFSDFNLSAVYVPNDNNSIIVNAFYSKDRLNYGDTNYAMDTQLRWENKLLSFGWTYLSEIRMTNRFFIPDLIVNLIFLSQSLDLPHHPD